MRFLFLLRWSREAKTWREGRMISGQGCELRVKRITQTSLSFGYPVTAVGLEPCLASMYVCSVYVGKGRDL